MTRVVVLSALWLISCVELGICAQSPYTDRLQRVEANKGKVTIVQDQSIDELVNNTKTIKAREQAKETETERILRLASQPRGQQPDSVPHPADRKSHEGGEVVAGSGTTTRPANMESSQYVRTRYKAQGFRIQVYTGGNTRQDKQMARQIEQKIRKAFPELSIYTHFDSPRWICRVGDFRSREDAARYLRLIKKANISDEVRIVSSVVLLAR